MRVLLATWPTASHYFTLVPPAWALRAAGHEVMFVSAPGVEGAAMRSGLTLSVAGEELDLASVWAGFTKRPGSDKAEHEKRRAARAFEMFALGAREMAGPVLDLAREWRPDLILFEPRMYAAVRAAKILGVPAVRVLPGPDYTLARDADEREARDRLFAELGISGADPFGDLTLDPCPPSMQIDDGGLVARQRMQFIPYAGPSVIPAWLAEPPERPRVFISLGSMVSTILGNMNFVHEAILAIASLDVEVLAGVFGGQADLLGELPGNVRVAEDVPLHLMLPSCDAVVHHGGGGTTLTTVAGGVPQLILASGGDTVLNARRTVASGAGASIPAWESTPAEIGKAVADVLAAPSLRDAARRVAAENRAQPHTSEVVARLETLAAHGAPASAPTAPGRSPSDNAIIAGTPDVAAAGR
ncbi:nucleotide disphospho-sugar-binding domain-containing protein [Actinomadura rupiterrae]|uniref:nucleotide disphospho-sugar-binding domain-containing protein n=1 Tax=Actinomadura rupiterrae TaxID=559627 RepID=UPI0020A4C8AB|nr:nucleotide disphospho-sugar-binding domain-containing protein [Actinomadura rupiterrae]MCP2341098.1 UDP:flavonoid glycosyltransferase YjiC (YdhE family) [Actinomadura rupiterrae]